MSDDNERKKYDQISNESESKSIVSPNRDANLNSNVEDDSGGGNNSFYSKLLRDNLNKQEDNLEEESESLNSDYEKSLIMRKNKKQTTTNEYQPGKKSGRLIIRN